VALGALAVALILLVAIALMRHVRRWRMERIAGAENGWRDALSEATEDPHDTRLAPIGRLEMPAFLVLWNHFQESLKGEAAERLGVLLTLNGIDRHVLRYIRKRSLRLRLIGITAAGHLREQRAWGELERLALHGGSIESFAAARALLRIEPRRALEVLAPALSGREDWSLARIGSIFQELGPQVVTGPLVTMLLKRPKRGLNRIVKLARFGHRDRISTIVRGWLGSSDEMEVLIAGLDYVEDDSDLPWVRMEQQGQVCEQLLREHVGARRGVDLAVDRERTVSSERFHRDRARGALAVVQERSGGERGTAINAGRHEARIEIPAGGQPLTIPPWAHGYPHGDRHEGQERHEAAATRQMAADDQRGRAEQKARCGDEQ